MHEKVRVVQVSQPAEAVAVIKPDFIVIAFRLYLLTLFLTFYYLNPAQAIVLPEDRADVLYHSYDGGGAKIDGPSILVRKKFNENFSATVNHYVDNVSSASIDVITTASPYTEKREENSVSIDYLHEKTLMTLGFTKSDESDFNAKTFGFNISQDMFGDLTTVTLGYAEGENLIGQNTDPSFEKNADTRNYRMSLTQVITKELIMAFALETITDEGFLNNPYRSVRYIDNTNGNGYSFQSEIYPNTRTSNSIAIRARYFLPHRAALHGGYRIFNDSWGISASTYELGYTLPHKEDWIFEFSYRYYDQTSADFYSDLFPFIDAQNFLARDKELSSFSDQTFGVSGSYEFIKDGGGYFKRGSVSFHYDRLQFEYDDFRDISISSTAGSEPNYKLSANVIRFFLSVWF